MYQLIIISVLALGLIFLFWWVHWATKIFLQHQTRLDDFDKHFDKIKELIKNAN